MRIPADLPFLVAEDAVLLVWHPDRGTRRWSSSLPTAVGRALLVASLAGHAVRHDDD